jgi:hypothetical protein
VRIHGISIMFILILLQGMSIVFAATERLLYICSDPYAKFSRWPMGRPIGKAVNPLVYGLTSWPMRRLGLWVNPLAKRAALLAYWSTHLQQNDSHWLLQGVRLFLRKNQPIFVLTNFSRTEWGLCSCITLKVHKELLENCVFTKTFIDLGGSTISTRSSRCRCYSWSEPSGGASGHSDGVGSERSYFYSRYNFW